MRGLQKTGWVVLFLYVLFAFRTEAVGYNATSIEPVTNGGRIASSELIEVFELKKNRDSQFFCPYLIEAGFGDLLGSNSKPSTCARNSLGFAYRYGPGTRHPAYGCCSQPAGH